MSLHCFQRLHILFLVFGSTSQCPPGLVELQCGPPGFVERAWGTVESGSLFVFHQGCTNQSLTISGGGVPV